MLSEDLTLLLSVPRASAIAAALIFAAGCSATTPPVSQIAAPALRMREPAAAARELQNAPRGWPKSKSEPILFVADGPDGILMFDPNKANGKPKGSITNGISGAAGLVVDPKGTLYVANISNNTVTVYPRGSKSPKYTISSGLSWPYGVGLDSKGNLFVSNIYSDTLTAYHKGGTTPYETILFDTYGQVMGVGVDAKDNVWVVSDYGPPYLVFEIPAGTTKVNNTGLQGLNLPLGIAFGKDDETYVSNLEIDTVDVYHYGSTKPYRTITKGIEHYSATLNGVTATDMFFQTNQNHNVVGYKEGASKPFSTLPLTEPLGVASWPLVKK